MTLTFEFLILNVVSKSRVTWATYVPILVFLGLSDVGPMYATDVRQTSDTDVRRQTKASLNAPPIGGGGITCITSLTVGPVDHNNDTLSNCHLSLYGETASSVLHLKNVLLLE